MVDAGDEKRVPGTLIGVAGRVLAAYFGLVYLRKRHSLREARQIFNTTLRTVEQQAGQQTILYEVYGREFPEILLRLAGYLQDRGTLGSAEEQRTVPLLPADVPPATLHIPLAQDILFEARGARTPEDLRAVIASYLRRRESAENEVARVNPLPAGEEASHDKIARELWAMWHAVPPEY